MKLIIYTDGASRGNPGQSSYGFKISDEKGNLIHKEGRCIGVTTNNVAEYTAVLEALRYIKKNLGKSRMDLEFFSDSRLVVEQLSGRFKIKSLHLKPIVEQIQILKMELGDATYNHIEREKNIDADRLANIALDTRI